MLFLSSPSIGLVCGFFTIPQNYNESYSAYYNIGSVETFEKNMDAAQTELGRTPTQAVPITYQTEVNVTYVGAVCLCLDGRSCLFL